MAYFYKTAIQREAEDFKIMLGDSIEALQIKQESLANNIGVGQSTMNNWLNTGSDRHLPAAVIANLPEPLRTQVKQYIDRKCGTEVNLSNLNGMIEDEVTDLAQDTGEFIKQYRADKSKKAKLVLQLNKMVEDIERLKGEVESR